MNAPVRLDAGTLGRLPPVVRVPDYDRSQVVPGMIHIGVGGFHRAHQAVYLDDLLHFPGSESWGYCGIGLLEQDTGMRDALHRQDCLYTVLERAGHGTTARVVGSIVDYLYAPDDREQSIARLASPDCRIVSLTITEGGYYLNDATGAFNDAHPDIVHDLAHPQEPRCSFGFIVAALDRRRRAGIAPFTVVSCDNLQHNGDIARRQLLAFAARRDRALHDWIEQEVAFPNSMVDRIVPATTQEHRDVLAREFGVDDAWPVATEPFRQWVIEDRFCNGRPAWERVGAQMTNDVTPYEKTKMRLLNGSHQALCYVGRLMGLEYAHEAIGEISIRRLVQGLMRDEVAPLLQSPPGIDLGAYQRTLLERFANPTIRDQLARIGTDGSARIPKFILPSIAEQLQRDGPIDALCFTVAAWFHYLAGRDDRGRPLTVTDAMSDRLVVAARQPDPAARALLDMNDLIDASLARAPRFRNRVTSFLGEFRESGARATLERFLTTRTLA
jgi:mannitol 2-dehydrogenase